MRMPLLLCLVASCVGWTSPARAGQTLFEFPLAQETVTSAGVFTPDGRLVRTLWALKRLPAGKQRGTWDGLDDLGRDVPPGRYEVRVALGNAAYRSTGTIGNSGVGRPMQAGTDDLLIDRRTGDIYTANNWEEAGQDFRKMDAGGKHLMDARFGVRNGTPNGWPIAVALDDGVLYCSVFTVNEKLPGQARTCNGGAVIRKFTADRGQPLKFPTPTGYIRVRLPDPKDAQPFEHQSLHSLAVCGDTLVAADRHTDRVYRFDKKTGRPLGEFRIKRPVCVVADGARLWIAYDGGKVAVTDVGGKVLARPAVAARDIVCIRRAGKDRLWVADQDKGQLQVYRIDAPDQLTLLTTHGRKARPGEFSPLAIGRIQSFDVMPDGGFVLAQTYGHGSIVTRFRPDDKVVWQQVGLEFCTNGTYDQKRPDLFVSSLLHAYRLQDRERGTWKYEGNLLGPCALAPAQSTGTPRILDLNGRRYYYQLTGDRVEVYRFEGDRVVPSALVGLSPRGWDAKFLCPIADKDRPAHFSWHDANGDGKAQPAEIRRAAKAQPIATFSCEVDAAGNLVIPDHYTSSVLLLPLARFDERGNPVYDWAGLRTALPRDDTLRGLRPMKVCPLPGGGMYVLQTADPSFYPPVGKQTGFGLDYQVCWMGGWVLSKYDRDGRRLFTIRLPDHCTGMDWVPNVGRTKDRGVVVGCYSAKQLYHYSPDGLLLGILSPKHMTGWLDHNGSISINRDPADGLADVFAEESLCNRISWYRMDDRKVATLKVAIQKKAAGDGRGSDEAGFYALLHAARRDLKTGKLPEALAAFAESLKRAVPREQPFVHEEMARASLRAGRPAEAVKHFRAAVEAPTYADVRKAELLYELSGVLERQKDYAGAVKAMQQVMALKTPADRQDVARARLRIADILRAQNRTEDALAEVQKVKDHFASGKQPNPGMYWQAYVAAAELRRLRKDDRKALQEYEQSLTIKGLDDNQMATSRVKMAECYLAMNRFNEAVGQLVAAAEKYPKADPNLRSNAYLRAGDCEVRRGSKERARGFFQQARDVPGISSDQRKAAEQQLARLK